MMAIDYISSSATDKEWWICRCGNAISADRFYHCDANGENVEPTPEDW